MDPDPDPLDVLAALPRYAGWRVWRGAGDGKPLVYAWRLRTSPPDVLRDSTVPGLRDRIDEYKRVLAETGLKATALAAAEALDTSHLSDREAGG